MHVLSCCWSVSLIFFKFQLKSLLVLHLSAFKNAHLFLIWTEIVQRLPHSKYFCSLSRTSVQWPWPYVRYSGKILIIKWRSDQVVVQLCIWFINILITATFRCIFMMFMFNLKKVLCVVSSTTYNTLEKVEWKLNFWTW